MRVIGRDVALAASASAGAGAAVLTLAPRQRQRLQRQSRSGRRTWCRFFGPQLELLWSFTSWAAQSDRYARMPGAWRLD